jgi:AcrR family transcriptional regulator
MAIRGAASSLKARQRARRDGARDKVRAAALKVFVAEGFEGTTMKALAVTAGLSIGMIYQLYESKADVLLDVITTHNAEQWAVLGAIAERESGLEGIIHLLSSMYAFDLRIPTLTGIAVAQSWLWDPEQERRHAEDMERKAALIAMVLRRGLPAAAAETIAVAAAIVLDSYYRGLRLGVFEAKTPEQCAHRLRPRVALLLRGLSATA